MNQETKIGDSLKTKLHQPKNLQFCSIPESIVIIQKINPNLQAINLLKS